MPSYHEQLVCPMSDIDLDFWRNPPGIVVPDDDLSFLLVPDAVESLLIAELATQVHEYQASAANSAATISSALIITMGGMLPGILLHDHLVFGRRPGAAKIDFGTIGAALYKGPDERLAQPQISQAPTLPVTNETVLLIDDLSDTNRTIAFMTDYLHEQGARQVLTLVVYMKPQAIAQRPADFYFGTVEQNCWIITPRELVETMVKRLPVWRERGASLAECRRRLVDLIGYPASVVDNYLHTHY